MRFPSLDLILSESWRVSRRFPLVVACSLIAAIAGMWLLDNTDHESLSLRLLLAASLGLAGFTAVDLFGERDRTQFTSWILRAIGIALLVGFFWAWPSWSSSVAWRRYLQISLAVHLLAAFLPYFRRGEFNGFWQYNRALFLRFLTAVLFSQVLYVGLLIALVALDSLLGVDVPEELYWRIWFPITFIFNTWYFLGGIPAELSRLEDEHGYPRALKVFAQYILLPIVALYLIILMAYLAKVLITTDWPSGWIGYMVSSVSAAGLLSLLLLHPIEQRAENRWVSTYARGFYLALLPAIVMLLLALGKRIDQYGVTENRYFIVVLALWMGAISVYFAIRRDRNIKIIPASLFFVAALSCFGPWGAYDISRRSQTGRLAGILEQNQLLLDGSLRPAETDVSAEDRREIGAILRYLFETHGVGRVDDWFGESWAEVDTFEFENRRLKRHQARSLAESAMAALDLEYVAWTSPRDDRFFRYWASDPHLAVDVSGFDLAFRTPPTIGGYVQRGPDRFEFHQNAAANVLILKRNTEAILEIDLADLINRMRARATGQDHYVTQMEKALIHQQQNSAVNLKMVIYNLAGERVGDRLKVTNLNADVYLRELDE